MSSRSTSTDSAFSVRYRDINGEARRAVIRPRGSSPSRAVWNIFEEVDTDSSDSESTDDESSESNDESPESDDEASESARPHFNDLAAFAADNFDQAPSSTVSAPANNDEIVSQDSTLESPSESSSDDIVEPTMSANETGNLMKARPQPPAHIKLKGSENYLRWSKELYNWMTTSCEADLSEFVDEDTPNSNPPVNPNLESNTAAQRAYIKNFRSWNRMDKYVRGIIIATLDDYPYSLVENIVHARAVWEKLKKTLTPHSTAQFNKLEADWYDIQRSTPESVSELSLRITTLKSDFSRLGNECIIPEVMYKSLFLRSLPSKFDSWVETFKANNELITNQITNKEAVSYDTMVTKALEAETDMKTRDMAYAAVAPPPEDQNVVNAAYRPKPSGTKNVPTCEHPLCKRRGHTIDTCRYVLAYKQPWKVPDSWLQVNIPEKAGQGNKNASSGPFNRNNKRPRFQGNKRQRSPEEDEGRVNMAIDPRAFVNLAGAALSTLNPGDGANRPVSRSWMLDSGANRHLTPFASTFVTLDYSQKDSIGQADGTELIIEGKGIIHIPTKHGVLILKDAWYAPKVRTQLVSAGKLFRHGYKVNFESEDSALITLNGTIVAKAYGSNDSWWIDPTVNIVSETRNAVYAVHTVMPDAKTQLWHQRMAHLGFQNLQKLEKMATGIALEGTLDAPICEPCVMGKAKSVPHRHPIQPATRIAELIHTDVMGPIDPPGTFDPLSDKGHKAKRPYRYIQTFTDDFSRYSWVRFLTSKNEATQSFLWFKEDIETQTSQKIARVRLDGGELLTDRFKQACQSSGIHFEPTAPYSPEENGYAERLGGILFEKARSMMFGTKLPKDIWPEIVYTANNLRNASPVATRDKTPIELLVGCPPDLSQCRVIGSKTFVKHPKELTRKLDDRAWEGLLVGFQGTSIYRVYDPSRDRVFAAHDVFVDEEPMIRRTGNHPDKRKRRLDPEDQVGVQTRNSRRRRDSVGESQKESASLPIVAMVEDSHHLEHDVHPYAEPLFAAMRDLARNPRNPTAAKIIQFFNNRACTTHTETGNHACPVHNTPAESTEEPAFPTLSPPDELEPEPSSYTESQNTAEAQQWHDAAEKEIASLMQMGVWELVKRPKDQKVLRGRWVNRRKRNMDGEVVKYKSRWVVRGYEQREGVDFNETYAPTVKSMAYKLLFARIAALDLECDQVDINTAFLNGDIDTQVYVEQPEGFEDGTGRVCLLKKSLYGLKQAPRIWYRTLRTWLAQYGLKPCSVDSSIFYNDELQVAVYVDDMVLAGSRKAIDDFKAAINNRFPITDIGPIQWFLGIKITRDRRNRTIYLSQEAAIDKIVTHWKLDQVSGNRTPMAIGTKFQAAPEGYTAGMQLKTKYQSAVGSLNYVCTCTRPDIAFAVGVVGRFSHNPTDDHWGLVRQIIRYLKLTKRAVLTYSGSIQPLNGYCDAASNDCLDTRRSTSGYTFNIGSGAISWSSKRQTIVTHSSTEAEYCEMDRAAREAVYLRHLCKELCPEAIAYPTPIVVKGDNKSAIATADSGAITPRNKHWDVRWHYCHQVKELGHVEFQFVRTRDQVADTLTKPLPKDAFERHRKALGIEV